MGRVRELAAIAVSAPVMVAGLAAVALAETWAMRLGGTAMVVGASIVLAVTGSQVRAFGWTLAVVGALGVLSRWF
jgi:hypothetical protein